MRARPTLLSLALLPLLLYGAGCGGHQDPVEPGDLSLYWTFDGLACDQVGVDAIEVTLDGLSAPDHDVRTVSCDLFYDGIHLYDLAEGTYRLTLRGLDQDGRLLYDRVTEVGVTAWTESSYEVDLVVRTGALSVWWETEATTSCADAYVAEVDVFLYQGADEVFSATYGCTQAGVIWDHLAPGDYEVFLYAYDAEGWQMGEDSFAAQVTRGTDNIVDAALLVPSADLTLYWTFDGDGTCNPGEVVDVWITSPFGQDWAGVNGEQVACADEGIQFLEVPPGVWTADLEMWDGSYLWTAYDVSLVVHAGASETYVVDLQ